LKCFFFWFINELCIIFDTTSKGNYLNLTPIINPLISAYTAAIINSIYQHYIHPIATKKSGIAYPNIFPAFALVAQNPNNTEYLSGSNYEWIIMRRFGHVYD
jgi:hypothetical protein